jgi:hypothetical protein
LPRISDPLDVIQELSCDTHFQEKSYFGKNIFSRIAEVAADPHFREFTCHLDNDPDLIPAKLAETGLLLYANTYNFTMLHAVTSNHALRLVLPYIQDKERAFNAYWNALLAAYITIHCPAIKEYTPPEKDIPEWDKIFAQAVQSDDAHVIKFVYTCFEESKVYHYPACRLLVAKKAGVY